MSMHCIDMHNHVIPSEILALVEGAPERYETRIEGSGDDRRIVNADHVFRLHREFFDVETKIASLDARRLDVAVVSPAPAVFFYWLPSEVAIDAARVVNDGVARMVAEAPDRLLGLGTLPLQSPEAAVAELERVVAVHGFRGIEVGTSVEAEQLSSPRFRPVLERAQALGVFLFAHPYFVGPKGGMAPYYLTNLIGNPLHTVIMAANLMFSGTLEALPDLRFLLSHGGGYLPYQLGRLARGWEVRADTRADSASPPTDLIRHFWFDLLTHSAQSSRFLIDQVGADRVVLGTDAPFPMQEHAPVDHLASVSGLTEAERAAIAHGNARRLLSPVGDKGA